MYGMCDCGAEFLGRQNHCKASTWSSWSLTPVLPPSGNAVPFQRAPDGGWVMAEHLPDALRADALSVKGGGSFDIDGRVVIPAVLVGSENLKVLRAVVGPVVVDVVNVLVFRRPRDNAMLVGFDVPAFGSPAESDVSMLGDITTRLPNRWFLVGAKHADGSRVGLDPQSATVVTAPSLAGGIGNLDPAVNAGNHVLIVQWSCHQTFSSEGSGDSHRIGTFEPPTRRCRIPEEMSTGGMWAVPNGAGTPVWHGTWNKAGVQHRREFRTGV